MRHVNKLLSVLCFTPFLFSPSSLLAQPQGPSVDELVELVDFDFEQFQTEYSQYEADYSKIGNDE